MSEATAQAPSQDIEALFSVGAHYGYKRSRRHPTAEPFIFGSKNRVEIFDLEKTSAQLDDAKAFVRELGRTHKTLLIVGGKYEAQEAVRRGADRIGQPFVSGRWIGGTLTNLTEIRKRVDRLEELRKERDSGELERKYTKKERLLLTREMDKLEEQFGGIVSMTAVPAALFIIDPRHEKTAVREARRQHVPIVSLSGSDCDMHESTYPVPGNDASRGSIRFFVDEIISAYEEGTKAATPEPKVE